MDNHPVKVINAVQDSTCNTTLSFSPMETVLFAVETKNNAKENVEVEVHNISDPPYERTSTDVEDNSYDEEKTAIVMAVIWMNRYPSNLNRP